MAKHTQYAILLLLCLFQSGSSLNYDPEDYLEVYPDPQDPDVLIGRIPLYFTVKSECYFNQKILLF